MLHLKDMGVPCQGLSVTWELGGYLEGRLLKHLLSRIVRYVRSRVKLEVMKTQGSYGILLMILFPYSCIKKYIKPNRVGTPS
jgi:hypothetical protein